MVLQFRVVSDNSLWAVDSDKRQYARLSRGLVDIFERPSDESAVEEFGKLVQINPLIKIFRLDGRTPSTDGPGGGLTSLAIMLDIVGSTLEITIEANVPIAEPACIKPINDIRCVVLGQAVEKVH